MDTAGQPTEHQDHTLPLHQRPYRWVILALLWFLYFSFGVVNRSPAPLVTPIIEDLGISYGQMGFILGSWQLTYIFFAITAGIIMDRWGIRRSIMFGAVVIAFSSIIRSASVDFFSLLIFVALFGIGGPMISIGCPKTIASWFIGSGRATAVGLYTTGPWIGGIVAFSATNSVIMPLTDYSWRWTFVIYGLMTLVFAGFWWVFSRDEANEGTSGRFNIVSVLAGLFRDRYVRRILLSGLLAFGVMHGYFSWLPKILENGGMSAVLAGYASALPLVASIPAVLIFPRFIAPRNRDYLTAILALTAAFSIIWVVVLKWPVIIGLLLFGISGPCLMPLLVLSLMEYPDVAAKYLGSATGVFFCVAEIGGFFGPFLVGYLVDLFGTFRSGGIFLSAAAFLIVLLLAGVRHKARQGGDT